MRVNKVMFNSVQFNMDEVDPLIIHDCIKTYPIEDLKLIDEVYQSTNHRPSLGLLNAYTCTCRAANNEVRSDRSTDERLIQRSYEILASPRMCILYKIAKLM